MRQAGRKESMNLGAHMSISGGVHLALERGLSIGCDAVQLFVKSSNQWRAREMKEDEIRLFREKLASFRPGFVVGHTSYLINIASPDPAMLEKSAGALLIEMQRCETLGIPSLILHPGSHRGSGVEAGVGTVGATLNTLFEKTAGSGVSILLENTAGAGNILGSSFEELAAMIELVEDGDRVGVCFDTCHAFAAGYDIRSKKAYDRTFGDLDRIVGLEKLRAFHLNDALEELGSRRDRHAHIGKGKLGLPAFRNLMRDKRFLDRPMILETPKGPDLAEDVENLAVLRSLRNGGA